jgi:hypothetical protein
MGTSAKPRSPQIEAEVLTAVFCWGCGAKLPPNRTSDDGDLCERCRQDSTARPPRPRVALVRHQDDPLLRLAIDKDLDIEKLKQLIQMRNEERDAEARRTFAAAMSEFTKRCPAIDKGKLVDYVTKSGVRIHYRHAELKDIQAVINPICGDLGLSYSWSNTIEAGKLTTTCTVLHRDGYSRSASFTCPVENSNPGMSDQQKPAGALTFGERYTIIQAFGLVTAEPDTDGEQDDQEKITEQQVTDLISLAEEVGVKTERILRAAMVEKLEDIPAARYPALVHTLEAKRGQSGVAK